MRVSFNWPMLSLLLVFATAACCSWLPPASALEFRSTYNVTQTTGAGTPRAFPPSGGTPLPRFDDSFSTVPLGFNFTFYGLNYTTANVADNGVLEFETMGSSWYTYLLPDDPSLAYMTPFIAGFWSDLKIVGTDTSNVTYATLGTTPNRIFVMRYNLPYYYDASKLNVFDIELYETTNVIRMRYYFMSARDFTSGSIAVCNRMHPDWTTEYAVYGPFNSVLLTPAVIALINDTTITFTPGPFIPYVSTAAPPVPFAQGTYNVSLTNATTILPDMASLGTVVPLAGSYDAVFAVPLGFPFWFYGANFTNIFLNTNGVIQFATASSTPTTETLPSATSSQLPFIAFAFSNWAPYADGMISFVTYGTPGSRAFRIHVDNVPHNNDFSSVITLDVILYEADSSIEVWFTSVPILREHLVVGIQSSARYNGGLYDYAVVANNVLMTPILVSSLSAAVVRFTVVNASIAANALPPVPKSFNSTVLSSVVPMASLSSTAITIEAANDNTDYIPFGFPYPFANSIFTGAFVTTNGELQFSSSVATYDPTLSFPLTSRAPVLMFFYTDLYPLLNAERSYQTTGTRPNRVFLLRHNGVPYTTTATSRVPPSITVDVLIFESDYRIEVRYYGIASSQQTVMIGAQSSILPRADGSLDAITLVNQQPISSIYQSLNQSTWILRPTNNTRLLDIPASSYSRVRGISTPPRLSLPSPTRFVLDPDTPDGYYTMQSVPLNFTFTFYGINYTSVWLSPFGYAQFANPYPYAIWTGNWPDGPASFAPYIATYARYFDFYSPYPDTPFDWRCQTIGTAPNRIFVVQWSNGTDGTPMSGTSSFDLLLYETTNQLEMRYYSLATSLYYSVSIGIIGSSTQRADGTYDFSVEMPSAYLTDDDVTDLRGHPLIFTPNATIAAALPDSYSLTVSTLPSLVPPTLFGQSYLSVLDDSSDAVPLDFLFSFYGIHYSYISVSSEGYLKFSSATAPAPGSQFPIFDSTRLPLLAYFWTNLYVPTSTSWMYVTTGVNPNRVFTLRLLGVQYGTELANATIGSVTLDVKLYEYDSHFTISYYNVSTSAQQVLIGTQGSAMQRYDKTYDYTTWVNQVPLTFGVVMTLNGQMLTFTPLETPTPPAPIAPLPVSYDGTYNVSHTVGVAPRVNFTLPTYVTQTTSLSVLPIGFPFRFFGINYTSVTHSPYGMLQFSTSSFSGYPGIIPGGNIGLTPFIAFAWTYLSPLATSVSYATIGTMPTRSFVLRYDRVTFMYSDSTISVDVLLNERDYSIEMRYYGVFNNLYYPLTIGLEALASPGLPPDYAVILNSVYATPTMLSRLSFSTLTFRFIDIGRVLPKTYNITRVASVQNVTLPSPRYIEGSNDNIDTIPIGFPFTFYGATYLAVQASSNGDLQFATSYAPYVTRRMPYVDAAVAPYLAYFYTDLYPMADTAKQYDSFGFYPNRQFVLRLTNVPYASTQAQANPPSVSIDVVLIETDYRIEVRYHRIDASAQTINVGVEGLATIRADAQDDYTALINQGTVGASSFLQGSTVVIRPNVPYPRVPYIEPRSYNVTSRPVPAPIVLVNPQVVTSLFDDDYTSSISIGFTFPYYGANYTSLCIGSNGNLQFGAIPSAARTAGATMPTGSPSVLPAILFAFADLYPGVAGTVSYASMGTAPARYFVVRFLNVAYFTSSSSNNDLSVDTILYEQGNITLRYYRIMPSASGDYMTIGVQGSATPRADGTYDFTPVNNYLLIPAASPLNGTEFTFYRQYGDGAAVEPSAIALTYAETFVDAVPRPSVSSLTGVTVRTFPSSGVLTFRASFPIPFFGSTYVVLRVSQNGVITFGTVATPLANATALPVTSTSVLPMLAVAFTSMTLASDATLTTATIGTFPNSVYLLRFDGLRYTSNSSAGVSVDVCFYQLNGTISMSYYRIDPTLQNMLIGLQASTTRRADYTYDFLAALNYGTAHAAYTATLLNRTIVYTPTKPIAAPVNLVAPTPVSVGLYNVSLSQSVVDRLTLSSPTTTGLPTGDNAVSTVSLQGITFVFHGASYTSVRVSTNGNIQFATSASTGTPVAVPTTSTSAVPFLAPFWTDLYSSSGMMQFQLLGTAPLRMFVLRYNSLRAASSTSITINADVLLYETTNVIEIRYYQISSFTTNVQIGMQNTTSSYATVWNAVAFGGATGANTFTYTTVTMTPIPAPAAPSSSVAPVPSSSAPRPSSSVVPASSSVVPSTPSSSVAPLPGSSSVPPTPSSSVAPTPSSSVAPAPSSSVAPTPSSSVAPTPSSSVVPPTPSSSVVPPTPSSSVPLRPSSSVAPPTPSSSVPLRPSSSVAPPTPSSSVVPPTPSSSIPVPSSSIAVLASSSAAPLTNSSGESASTSSSLGGGAIAGIVIGVVIALVVVTGIFIVLRSRSKSNSSSSTASPSVFNAVASGHAQLEESHTTAGDRPNDEVELVERAVEAGEGETPSADIEDVAV